MIHRTSSVAVRFGLLLAVAAVLLSGCAQTSTVDEWQSDTGRYEPPQKMAVMAVLPDALMRKAFERDTAAILADRGFPAVAASNIPGLSGGIRGEIDTEVATRLLRDAGVDGIMVMFLAGEGQSEGYVRSDYWLQHVGSGMGYSWGRPYFTDVYTVRQGPGWADFRTIVYVESSYYDLSTESPAWRIVTRTKDMEHTDAARDIAQIAAREMRSAGLRP